MRHHSASHHVQLDVTKAAPQIFAAFDERRVKIVAPERVGASLAPIVSPHEFPGHRTHQPADLLPLRGIQQQMDVVGREAIVQQSDIEMAQVLPKAGAVKVTVTGEFQEERAMMTSMVI